MPAAGSFPCRLMDSSAKQAASSSSSSNLPELKMGTASSLSPEVIELMLDGMLAQPNTTLPWALSVLRVPQLALGGYCCGCCLPMQSTHLHAPSAGMLPCCRHSAARLLRPHWTKSAGKTITAASQDTVSGSETVSAPALVCLCNNAVQRQLTCRLACSSMVPQRSWPGQSSVSSGWRT